MFFTVAQLDPYYNIAKIVEDLSNRQKTEKDEAKLEYIDTLLKESEPLLQHVFDGTASQESVDLFLEHYSYLKNDTIPDLRENLDFDIDVEIGDEEDLYPYFLSAYDYLSQELASSRGARRHGVMQLLELVNVILSSLGDVYTFPYTGEVPWEEIKKFQDLYSRFLAGEFEDKDIMQDFDTFKQFVLENIDELEDWSAFSDLVKEFKGQGA